MSKIGVLSYKNTRGIDNVNGPHTFLNKETRQREEFNPRVMEVADDIFEIMNFEFGTDAHFTCYTISGAEDEAWPRLRKPAVSSIREAGCDVVSKYIVMDWDTPKQPYEGKMIKTPLNDELVTEFAKIAYEHEGEISKWCACYTTQNGGRLVYQLPIAVPVEVQEEYTMGIILAWKRAGIEMDMQCKDWTRLFRAPKVIRDDVNTEESEFYFLECREDAVLNPEKIHRVAGGGNFIPSNSFNVDVPASEELQAILYTNKGTQTPFFKQAKKIMKGTEQYEYAFGDEYIEDGERNNKIMSLLGFTTPRLLKKIKGLTPEQVFALFYDRFAALEPDSGTSCWISHAWNAMGIIWERDVERYNTAKLVEATTQAEAMETIDSMVEGMQKWCDAEEIHSHHKEIRHDYLRSHCIAAMGSFYFILGPDGAFDYSPITEKLLISKIRKSHMKEVIETTKTAITGEEVDVSANTIVNNHTVPVDKIIKQPQLDIPGYIDDIYGKSPKLHMPMYRRNPDIEGEWNNEVDQWLVHLFGIHYERGCEWIAQSLAFEDGIICALSIKGPGSIGKKLLTEGLSECLENPICATGEDVCGSFNEALCSTPFLVINEGWPTKNSNKSPDTLFKQYTAGDPITVSEKFKPNIQVINPMRIIFTANDHDILYELIGSKNVSPESRQAIGERLLHFDVSINARMYLESLGGKEFTEREGCRWIRSDTGGNNSDYVVAKHFMYLYENREEVDKKNRYLVMGNSAGSDHTMYSQLLQRPAAASCVRAIIQLTRSHATTTALRIEEDTGKLFVTVDGIYSYITVVLEEKISMRDVQGALKNVAKTEGGTIANHIKWTEIDVSALLNFATDMGIDAGELRTLDIRQHEVEMIMSKI